MNKLITPRSLRKSIDLITTNSGSFTNHAHITAEFNTYLTNVAQEITADLPPYCPIKLCWTD